MSLVRSSSTVCTWLVDSLRTGVPLGSQAASFFHGHSDGQHLAHIYSGWIQTDRTGGSVLGLCFSLESLASWHTKQIFMAFEAEGWPSFIFPFCILTCTVRSLVGPLRLEAFLLPLGGQSSQLGGDLLLHGRRLVHLVGGADQLDGQLGLGRLRADTLLARWNLWRNFRGVRGGGQDVQLRRQGQTPTSVHYASPERLVTGETPRLGRKKKSITQTLLFQGVK